MQSKLRSSTIYQAPLVCLRAKANLRFSYLDTQNQYQPYFTNDISLGGFYQQNQQHPMAVTSLLDTSLPETVLSDEKSQEIIDLIKERFNETDHAPVAKQKEALLEGDRNEDSHMMSRKMMQTYIGSFWWHFHPQLPICEFTSLASDFAALFGVGF
jgi:hypothetical protein